MAASGAVRADQQDPAHRSRLIEVLADRDDALLATYVEDEAAVTDRRLRDALRAQTARALVHPVFAGSAVTGAGVPQLMAALVDLLPAGAGDDTGPVSGRVFKVERGPAGERVAYVRLSSGAVRTRDRLQFAAGDEAKVTGVSVFDQGSWVRRGLVRAAATIGPALATVGRRGSCPG